MHEQEWLWSNTAPALIAYAADYASERKLRLFACAACRRILHLLESPEFRKAVEVSERFADGQSSLEELTPAGDEALTVANYLQAVVSPGLQEPRYRWWNAARTAALSAARNAREAAERAAEAAADPDLVRDHFGNPFRPLVVSPDVLSWQDRTVVRLAQAAYDERNPRSGTLDNGRIAILADALEEADYTDELILEHLRGGDRHYRGCFVVDALLGKT